MGNEAMEREVVFNEVIYGLEVLEETLKQAQTVSNENWRGVGIAVAYVKAMKKAEQ